MADIHVQVCYARPDRQWLLDLRVQEGTTLEAAIMLSEIVKEASEIDLSVCRIGICGKLKTRDTVLREYDRVEIYRPLTADPKESRRKRAVKKGDKKAR